MRNLWRRFLALLHRPVPVALSVGTGPVLMVPCVPRPAGGSVRVATPEALVMGYHFDGPYRYATIDQLCGGRTWEGE